MEVHENNHKHICNIAEGNFYTRLKHLIKKFYIQIILLKFILIWACNLRFMVYNITFSPKKKEKYR